MLLALYKFSEFEVTCEYMRHSGRLMAMERNHTKTILRVTLFLVLLRPNFIG